MWARFAHLVGVDDLDLDEEDDVNGAEYDVVEDDSCDFAREDEDEEDCDDVNGERRRLEWVWLCFLLRLSLCFFSCIGDLLRLFLLLLLLERLERSERLPL
jgi:hypothetical protein